MNKSEAQKLVEEVLAKETAKNNSLECVVLVNETIEKEWGWVFFYQNKKYLETGDFRDMLGGNAPYIVNRTTGNIIETGTAQSIKEYISEYEQTL